MNELEERAHAAEIMYQIGGLVVDPSSPVIDAMIALHAEAIEACAGVARHWADVDQQIGRETAHAIETAIRNLAKDQPNG